MNSRKTAREAVSTLLATISTFQAVYDRQTPDFGGLSPVAMVCSDGSRWGPGLALGQYQREHALIIAILWKWQSTSEDDLDDLSEDVFDLIEANDETNDWGSLALDEQFSVLDYPIVDGVMYRREQIRVLIW